MMAGSWIACRVYALKLEWYGVWGGFALRRQVAGVPPALRAFLPQVRPMLRMLLPVLITLSGSI